jgi:alkylated DNA repair protein alkB family protein 1
LAADVAAVLFESAYSAEAAIVNYYPMGATLAGHTDKSEENMLQALISVSLGQEAIFLIGGPTKATPPVALRLRSGDVVVLSGEARANYHAVPRIVATEDSPWVDGSTDENVLAYLKRHRVNVSIRQVH